MNTGVGFHAVLQGIFLIQGLNPCLLHCTWILSTEVIPSYQKTFAECMIVDYYVDFGVILQVRILKWFAIPFSTF